MWKEVSIVVLSALAAALHGAGCVSFGKSDPASLYLLSTLEPPVEQSTAPELVLGIRSVVIPEYLSRPEIVRRPSAHRVTVTGFDRWAQPLDEEISRALAANLVALVPGARVVESPWQRTRAIDHEIEISVFGFEQVAGGDVVLTARWSVRKHDDGTVLASRITKISKPCETDDYEALVATMSDALADLSREIAAAVTGAP